MDDYDFNMISVDVNEIDNYFTVRCHQTHIKTRKPKGLWHSC